MQIKDMHIEVSQSTQNIAAAVRRKLLAPEIDWLLNKNQERFIQSKITLNEEGGIEQLDVDALRTLINTETTTPRIGGSHTYITNLPSDYSSLLETRVGLNLTCNKNYSVSSKQQTVYYAAFNKTIKAAAPFFTDLRINAGGKYTNITNINADYNGSYTGVNSPVEISRLRDIMLWEARNHTGQDLHWEYYFDLYKPKHVISLKPDLAVAIDTVDQTEGSVDQVFHVYDYTPDKWSAARHVVKQLNEKLQDPYHKSHPESPIMELRNRLIRVYGDERFIVSKVEVEYLKKARRMDLILGQDCELPEEYHQAICDLTSEYIKAMTSDPNWEVKLRDNMQRSVPI